MKKLLFLAALFCAALQGESELQKEFKSMDAASASAYSAQALKRTLPSRIDSAVVMSSAKAKDSMLDITYTLNDTNSTNFGTLSAEDRDRLGQNFAKFNKNEICANEVIITLLERGVIYHNLYFYKDALMFENNVTYQDCE